MKRARTYVNNVLFGEFGFRSLEGEARDIFLPSLILLLLLLPYFLIKNFFPYILRDCLKEV